MIYLTYGHTHTHTFIQLKRSIFHLFIIRISLWPVSPVKANYIFQHIVLRPSGKFSIGLCTRYKLTRESKIMFYAKIKIYRWKQNHFYTFQLYISHRTVNLSTISLPMPLCDLCVCVWIVWWFCQMKWKKKIDSSDEKKGERNEISQRDRKRNNNNNDDDNENSLCSPFPLSLPLSLWRALSLSLFPSTLHIFCVYFYD